MSKLDHKNITKFIGVCIDNQHYWILLEYMEGGDLVKFLRSVRPTCNEDSKITVKGLLKIASDVMTGCEYLEQMRFVHRDLAARNCLLTSRDIENNICKIGDFGLSRSIYKSNYYRLTSKDYVPVRWMAPEALKDKKFTLKTDVWAFGVLLWEIMSLGEQPYACYASEFQAAQYIINGGRLTMPVQCPTKIFDLINNCTATFPHMRPKFQSLLQDLNLFITQSLIENLDAPFLPSLDNKNTTTVNIAIANHNCNDSIYIMDSTSI